METSFCKNCSSIICIERVISDFYETNQGSTLWVITCKECGVKNAISWEATVEFNSTIAKEEDIEIQINNYWEEF